MKVTINKEQKLYVIPCGQGYSCLGFDVAFNKLQSIHNELSKMVKKQLPELPKRKGTMKVYNQLKKLESIAFDLYKKHGVKLEHGLTEQLIGLEGKRVEVLDGYGEVREFKVGKSTGWIPCHLELSNSRSSGGMSVMGAPFKYVRVVG